MSLFVFNNQQKLIKSIPNRDLISVVQDQAINVSDTLFVELPADIWSNLKEPASYLAVQDPYERFSYHMYKVSKHTTKADTTDVEAIQIGYDELKAYGYIKDRRFNNRPVLEAATAVVSGTDWQLGYIDTNLPNVNINFYYISRLEALSKLIEATGAEVRFRVEISGNKIIAKRLDLYKKLGTFKGKRFAYGSNLLEIVKEEDTSELYTALVGRGKGEETDTGGFGRRITFADIAWSKASGKPVDKPLGQEFIELPEMTAYYGYPDGEPRTGIVEFGDIEEPEQLLKATYERLVEISRPQVHFKAKVQTTGDMQLGEEVAIIRSDLGFRYKTRVFRVKRDYLNNMYTEVELGDNLTETLASRIKKIDTTNAQREETIIQYIQTAANGKNKIFRGPVEPTEGMMVNDLWYKPVGEGETMLYTWNGEIWELSKVSAGLLAGTLDAENGDVNLINVNVANIVGEISEFIKSYWNTINSQITIDGSEMKIMNLSTGVEVWLKNGGIEFRQHGNIRYLRYTNEGLMLVPGINNTGAALNGSLHIQGGIAYLQFANNQNQIMGRIEFDNPNKMTKFHSENEVRFIRYSDEKGVGIAANGYRTVDNSGAGSVSTLIGNRWEAPGDATKRNLYIKPNGQGSVVASDHAETSFYNMVASSFVNASSREYKTNIEPATGSGMDRLNALEVVTFDYKKDAEAGIVNRQIGFIAEDSPAIASPDRKGIDHSKVIAYLVKAVQEKDREIQELKAVLAQKGLI